MILPKETIFVSFAFLLAATVINAALIMIIWNHVLKTKVKGAALQKINFWEALAVGVFFTIVFKGSTIFIFKNKCGC